MNINNLKIANCPELASFLGASDDGMIDLNESALQAYINDNLSVLPSLIVTSVEQPEIGQALIVMGNITLTLQRMLKELKVKLNA